MMRVSRPPRAASAGAASHPHADATTLRMSAAIACVGSGSETGVERTTRSMCGGPDGALGGARHGGDLGDREAVDIEQGEEPAVAIAELSKRVVHGQPRGHIVCHIR